MTIRIGHPRRWFAKVVGCIAPNCVDVCLTWHPKLHHGGVPTQVPIEIVPNDLRFPNREFILVLDAEGKKPERVERFDPAEIPDEMSEDWYFKA